MSWPQNISGAFAFIGIAKGAMLLWVFGVLILPCRTLAQSDSSGLYMNEDDFKRHKISLATPCTSRKYSIHLHNRPFLSVTRNGHKVKYTFRDVFGYRDCDGINYRFYLDAKYQVLSSDHLILYSQLKDVGLGEIPYYERIYFFSEKLNSIIYPLTFHYLDWVYRRDTEFLKNLYIAFSADKDLSAFDDATNSYTLISIYKETTNHNID